MSSARLHVVYKGRVQGVGFRFTAEEIAMACDVKGWVKNLGNGDVEIMAEGKREALEALLTKMRKSRVGHCIEHEVKNWSEGTGEFKDFTIEYVY